jgi:uncharacterized membrane protein
LSVTVPTDALGCTRDNVAVRAIGTGVENSATCVAHAAVVRGVSVGISPSYRSGLPGGELEYTVTVKNTGNVWDNYTLTVADDAMPSWGPTVSTTSLEVPAGGSRTATVSVRIPDGTPPCTRDNIVVRATSQSDNTVSAENSTIAHAAGIAGVEISISPTENFGPPGSTLNYVVTVRNTGLAWDNYILTAEDILGWDLIISPNLLPLEPGTSGDAVLSVSIPADELPGVFNDIEVTATSQVDDKVSARAACLAYAGHRTVIHPIDDAYVWGRVLDGNYNGGELVIGENADAPIRTWVKFDLSGIPSSHGVARARLWLYFHGSAGGGAPGGIAVHFSENDFWTESGITWGNQPSFSPSPTDNVPQFTDVGWKSWTVTRDAEREFEGDGKVTWCLKGSSEGSGDDYNMAYSEDFEDPLYRPYLEVLHAQAYKVSISVSPEENSGLPGSTLTYKVTVKNTGGLNDNYSLTVIDNAGWSLTLPENFLSIPAGENRVVTLNVGVPADALAGQEDNITVIASGTGVSASASCIARASIFRSVRVTISPSYDNGSPGAQLTYTVIVKNASNVADNYILTAWDNAGWLGPWTQELIDVPPGENRTTYLRVTIPSGTAHCTRDNITVVATSLTDGGVRDNASCVAHAVVPVRRVEISISPSENRGAPGATLTYTVTVKNAGNVTDNYLLENRDDLGWPLSLDDASLSNVQAGESRATMLRVTIPSGVTPKTRDIVTVRAIGTGVENSAACAAIAAAIREVEVSISPKENSGLPGTTLRYVVTIKNTGLVRDNYDLAATDTLGWGPTISPTSLSLEPNASGNATLSVRVPETAAVGAEDKVTVTATSQTDSAVSARAVCVAYSGYRTVIHPIDDAYVWGRVLDGNYNGGELVIGENADAPIRTWVKFDLSGIPSSHGVARARLWLYFHGSAGGGAPGGIAVHFSENDFWTESGITWGNQPSFSPSPTDNVPQFTDVGWKSWTVTRDAEREFEGDGKVTWCLKGSSEGSGDDYNMAYSKEFFDPSYRPYLEVIHAPTYRVSVSVSPSENSGLPGSTLTYKVTVKNTGAFSDTYTLTVSENASPSWNPSISPTSLAVPAGENRVATLTVTIPSGALAGQGDNITVTATGAGVSASASCIARATPLRKVEVSISPENRKGSPGATLTYAVTVKNAGNVADNYKLTVRDNAVPSWGPTVSPENLMLAAGASETATLNVKVPENIAGFVSDNIRITVTSLTDNKVSASAICIAHAEVSRGVEVTISPGENSGPPGATLTYKVTVKNTGNVPDNYSLTTSDNENWVRTISPTLLTVPAGENRTATLSVTIPSDATHSRRDNVRVVATSQADNAVSASGNCIAHAVIIRKVEISIFPTSASGAPGATLTYTVAVKNAGNIFDNYDLTVADNMGWRTTLSPTSLAMHAGENRTATLSVTIPSDAAHSMRSRISVVATSRLDNAVSASASCEAHATTAKRVEISISPSYKSGRPGETLIYTVTIRNIGQVDDTYALSATSAVGWTTYIEPASISLVAGASGEVKLSVTIPPDVSEGTSMIINVKATSTTDPAVSAMETCRAIALGRGVPLPTPLPVVQLAISAALAIAAAVTIKFFRGKVRRPRFILRERKAAKGGVLRGVAWGKRTPRG